MDFRRALLVNIMRRIENEPGNAPCSARPCSGSHADAGGTQEE
jgi:hypothetical protein